MNIANDVLRGYDTLRKIVGGLVNAYQPERIYLFGSRARDDSKPESDCDLLIVVAAAARSHQSLSALAYKGLWSIGAAADVLVYTAGDFDAGTRVAASYLPQFCAKGN